MKIIYNQITMDDVLNTEVDDLPIHQVLIINGTGGVGKGTFVSALKKYISVYSDSIINPVKDVAFDIGWNNDKSEKGRAFLSELKIAMDKYNDYPFTCMAKLVNLFNSKVLDEQILCIDMREPKDIERAKKEFGAKSVLVVRPGVKQITSNIADASVFDTTYDYIIDNSKDEQHLHDEIKVFLRRLKGDIAHDKIV